LTAFRVVKDCYGELVTAAHTHIFVYKIKRLTGRNLNNKTVKTVATAQSLINVAIKISVKKN